MTIEESVKNVYKMVLFRKNTHEVQSYQMYDLCGWRWNTKVTKPKMLEAFFRLYNLYIADCLVFHIHLNYQTDSIKVCYFFLVTNCILIGFDINVNFKVVLVNNFK